MSMGVFIYIGIPGHSFPLVVIVLGERFVLEGGQAEKEANEQKDDHGNGVGKKGFIPGFLHGESYDVTASFSPIGSGQRQTAVDTVFSI
jgi:hypothetical protein